MIKNLLFPLESDTDQLSENDYLINEFLYENDLKEEEKKDDKNYILNVNEIYGNLTNELKKNPKESSLFKKGEKFEDIHEPFDNLNNLENFQNSLDSVLQKNEEIQKRFDLKSQEQDLKILNEVDEMKLFKESQNKEFSSRYSRNKIFNIVRLNSKRRRKYMGDDKRKRIKSDFYKQIKIELNKQLKKQKIKMLFNWPQIMVTDITKDNNKNILSMTLGKLLLDGELGNKYSKSKRKEKKT